MKKILFFALLCLVIGVTANAKVTKSTKAKPNAAKTQVSTYKVEQVNKVFMGENPISIGSSINGNTMVEIKEKGYMMFVDNVAKKRYYVSRPCKAMIKNLVTEVKKPKSVAKSFLESVMTKNKNADYSSSGNVERKPTPVWIENVEVNDKGEMKVYMIE